jgi:ethanolamine utilization protein EutN
MKLGKVIGTVVATQKDPSLDGVRLLLLQPLDEQQREKGEPLVACDAVQSNVGDVVLFEGGREAAMALEEPFNPSDATILAVVDRAYVEESG